MLKDVTSQYYEASMWLVERNIRPCRIVQVIQTTYRETIEDGIIVRAKDIQHNTRKEAAMAYATRVDCLRRRASTEASFHAGGFEAIAANDELNGSD